METKTKVYQNRSRGISVGFRMNPEEYADLQKDIQASGLKSQSYLLGTIKTAIRPTPELVQSVESVNLTLNNLRLQINAIGRNLNQIAAKANTNDFLTSSDWRQLRQYMSEVEALGEEVKEQCRLLRTLTTAKKAKGKRLSEPTTKPTTP